MKLQFRPFRSICIKRAFGICIETLSAYVTCAILVQRTCSITLTLRLTNIPATKSSIHPFRLIFSSQLAGALIFSCSAGQVHGLARECLRFARCFPLSYSVCPRTRFLPQTQCGAVHLDLANQDQDLTCICIMA